MSEVPSLPLGRHGVSQRHLFPYEYQPGKAYPPTATPSASVGQDPVLQPDTTFTPQQTHLVAELTRNSCSADYIFAMYHRHFPENPKQMQQIKEMRTKVLNEWMKKITGTDSDVEDIQQVMKQKQKMEVKVKLIRRNGDEEGVNDALHKIHAKLEDEKQDEATAAVKYDKNELADEHKEPSRGEELGNLPLSLPYADDLSQKRIWNPRKRQSDEAEGNNPSSKRSSQSDSPWTRII